MGSTIRLSEIRREKKVTSRRRVLHVFRSNCGTGSTGEIPSRRYALGCRESFSPACLTKRVWRGMRSPFGARLRAPERLPCIRRPTGPSFLGRCGQTLRELAAAHARHDHVGHEQIVPPLVRLGGILRLLKIFCDDDVIAAVREILLGDAAKRFLVFHRRMVSSPRGTARSGGGDSAFSVSSRVTGK